MFYKMYKSVCKYCAAMFKKREGCSKFQVMSPLVRFVHFAVDFI